MAKNICDGHLEFGITFIPLANCSAGERSLPSWATCYLIWNIAITT